MFLFVVWFQMYFVLVKFSLKKDELLDVFKLGADLKERLTMPQEEVGPFVSKIKEIFSKIFGLPIPTIAALDGELRHQAKLNQYYFRAF